MVEDPRTDVVARALNPEAWAMWDANAGALSEFRESLVEHTRLQARRVVAALDSLAEPPPEATLMCRTFSADAKDLICDKPARYIVWGVLYGKQHTGPKCWEHAPKPRMGHDAVEQDYVAVMPHAAIYEIPRTPPAWTAALESGQSVRASLEVFDGTWMVMLGTGSDEDYCIFESQDRDEAEWTAEKVNDALAHERTNTETPMAAPSLAQDDLTQLVLTARWPNGDRLDVSTKVARLIADTLMERLGGAS